MLPMLLLKNPKVIFAAGAALVLFAAGWAVNGWRLEANFADAQVRATEEYQLLQDQMNRDFAITLQEDQARRIALSRAMSDMRTRTASLQKELETVANFTTTTPGECATKLSPDFVRIWNASTDLR